VTDDREATAEFWDAQAAGPDLSVYWFFHPLVRDYINESMTGVAWGWPHLYLKARPELAYLPRKRGISIGCGIGNVERSLRLLRVAETIDAFDLSPESIRQARETAASEGIDGIRFEVGDCDTLDIADATYDIAFFNHSLHHVSDPHALLARVARWLVPGGILYVDDYVGPSRDTWQNEDAAARELREARRVFETLPAELKVKAVDPPLDLRDPSEMIRSEAIRDAVAAHFEIVHERPYWGNLLFPLLNALDGTKLQRDEYQPLLRELIATERELVAAGAFARPLFTFLIGRRRESGMDRS
jgi:ubiquinone/menaquinone biosynthesis C-methylase UbiE